ncbi:acyl-CoA N-acyltransferase [Echria macrotheca]|uniref:Acyl-CoA N-acyltransferase n=1 Tax=Echria macrotheca TaxID=438768 RepID=A0AAJ0B5Z7_9PEZI|nr:acyl-CoA N-acyltransferase [Echria macrotheca]
MPWRQMIESDLPAVQVIADTIHHALPESASVFASRLRHYPKGCIVYTPPDTDASDPANIKGYIMSFPIRHTQPPPLETHLTPIPEDANQFYMHDVVVMPECRRQGAAREGITRILELSRSEGFETTCLVSVYGTVEFWGRFGFKMYPISDELTKKIKSYGDEAEYLVRPN